MTESHDPNPIGNSPPEEVPEAVLFSRVPHDDGTYSDARLTHANEAPGEDDKSVVSGDTEHPNNGEAVEAMTDERLQEIIDTSYYTATAVMSGQKTITNLRADTHGVLSLERRGVFSALRSFMSTANIEEPFTRAGISEIVTIAGASDFHFHGRRQWSQGDKWGKEPYSDEPVYVIEYTTLTYGTERVPGRQQKYPYRENYNPSEPVDHMAGKRRPTSFSYAMVLPKSLAEELGNAMRADPELARTLGDALMVNEQGKYASSTLEENPFTKETWHNCRPPYELWREINGGVDQMAFLTASGQTVDQAKIVEF